MFRLPLQKLVEHPTQQQLNKNKPHAEKFKEKYNEPKYFAKKEKRKKKKRNNNNNVLPNSSMIINYINKNKNIMSQNIPQKIKMILNNKDSNTMSNNTMLETVLFF